MVCAGRKTFKSFATRNFSRIFASPNDKNMQDDGHFERLSQESECRNENTGDILERASAVAHGVLEEIEALAGTTACKSVQLVRLKQWAQENGCWFSDHSTFGDYFDRGSENEAYLSPDGRDIIKLNDFRYSDDNLSSFFERIKAHNQYFDACPYLMIGFSDNQEGKVCAVLLQPFIAEARLATKQEIHDEFLRLGFHPEDNGAYYTNGQHDIFDAVPNNVLMGDDGHLYFIDTIIYPSDSGGYDKYHSLSPRFSGQ